jgi:hypothetical protein
MASKSLKEVANKISGMLKAEDDCLIVSVISIWSATEP